VPFQNAHGLASRASKVDSQSWDAALNVVQKSLVEIAVANKLNSLEDDPLIAEAFRQCDELRASKYLAVVRTNRDLAKKYAISPAPSLIGEKRAARLSTDDGPYLPGSQDAATRQRSRTRSLQSN